MKKEDLVKTEEKANEHIKRVQFDLTQNKVRLFTRGEHPTALQSVTGYITRCWNTLFSEPSRLTLGQICTLFATAIPGLISSPFIGLYRLIRYVSPTEKKLDYVDVPSASTPTSIVDLENKPDKAARKAHRYSATPMPNQLMPNQLLSDNTQLNDDEHSAIANPSSPKKDTGP
ncbi:MAG: hypothetical protein V4490_04590 [Pseudomonadota bacterium]